MKVREEEYNHFTQTTKKIIWFLKCFNGKVDNYSTLIETVPDEHQLLSFLHSPICHPRSSSSQPISLKIDQLDIRDLYLIEQFSHYQDSTVFRDMIDHSLDEFRSTKNTTQLDDLDSESEEDENMSSDVLNILIDEIVSPVIEQSKEIGISLKNCTISLGTVNKLFENYKKDTGGLYVELVPIESIPEKENEYEKKNFH